MLSSLDRQFSQRKMSISKEKFSWTEAYNPENPTLSQQLYASNFLFQSEAYYNCCDNVGFSGFPVSIQYKRLSLSIPIF